MHQFSKAGLSLVFGALAGLAMPPIDAWWIFAISFPALLLLIEEQSLKRAFFLGWLFGCGYFLVVLHWIGFAFLVNAAADLWMMPFAVGGLAAFLALYWGLGAALTRYCSSRGFNAFWVAPIFFSVMELLRGTLFTGFPWGVPGLAADGMGGVAQLAYFIGMNGLTLLVLLWAATPLHFLQGHKVTAVFVLLSLPLCWIYGDWRLAQNPTTLVEAVHLRIVQPNVPQDDNWRNQHARDIFDELLNLSSSPSQDGQAITHIIWPESIVPFLIDESPKGLSEVAAMLGPQRVLLTGAVRRSSPSPDAAYFTSVLGIDGNGKVIGHYDKSHLVPGGEYLPLAWILEPLGFRQVVPLPESFGSGPGPQSMAVPGAGLVGAQVCYEAIFPAETVDPKQRPDWLVNVTNDGWFGKSTGPWQHLAQLRLRAIEQGLAVARSANTGISAVFDPYGRALFQSEIGVAGVYDSALPKSIEPGVYARFGDGILWGLIVVAAILGFGARYLRVLIS